MLTGHLYLSTREREREMVPTGFRFVVVATMLIILERQTDRDRLTYRKTDREQADRQTQRETKTQTQANSLTDARFSSNNTTINLTRQRINETGCGSVRRKLTTCSTGYDLLNETWVIQAYSTSYGLYKELLLIHRATPCRRVIARFPDPWPWLNNCLGQWGERVLWLYEWHFHSTSLARKSETTQYSYFVGILSPFNLKGLYQG